MHDNGDDNLRNTMGEAVLKSRQTDAIGFEQGDEPAGLHGGRHGVT